MPSLGISPRDENVRPHTDSFMNVHGGYVHNSENRGPLKCPSAREWMHGPRYISTVGVYLAVKTDRQRQFKK